MLLSFECLCVVRSFLADPQRQFYAYRIAKETELHKGTVRSILTSLERQKWVQRVGEQESTAHRKMMRSVYQITKLGIAEGGAALSQLQMPGRVIASSVPQSAMSP